MKFILLIISIAAALALATQAVNAIQISRLRHSGLYPKRGQATIADVDRLLRTGDRILAMRCYHEIHGCSLRQAKEAVEKRAG